MRPMLPAVALLIATAGLARAMEIRQFDKMTEADQDQYVAELVVGASKVLRDEGKQDLADQVRKLFIEIPAGDRISVGMGEFEINLAAGRVADLQRIEKDPKARRLEVEDAQLRCRWDGMPQQRRAGQDASSDEIVSLG